MEPRLFRCEDMDERELLSFIASVDLIDFSG